MSFTFIDLFSGIGGFHQALEGLGGKCLLACEIDKKAADVYKNNFKSDRFCEDIFKLEASEIQNHDILTAGFPCQPFSISGKHKGLNDDRSQVFPELVRIIRETQPKVFILENVKHIQHISGGMVFEHINRELVKSGYHLEFKVLNASKFGVPQNRERVFWVGAKCHYAGAFVDHIAMFPASFIRGGFGKAEALPI